MLLQATNTFSQSLDPVVIDELTALAQLRVNHRGTMATMTLPQCVRAAPGCDPAAAGSAERSRSYAPTAARGASIIPGFESTAHGPPPNRCGYQSFRSASRVNSFQRRLGQQILQPCILRLECLQRLGTRDVHLGLLRRR